MYAVYVQNIGGGILDVGNTIAIYSITTGILIILFGKMSDYVSKELLAVCGLALSALGTLGYLYVQTTYQLYMLQILFAISTALLSAPLSALFAQHIDIKKSGFMWALEGGGGKIVAGIGVLIGTTITYTFGFTAMFLTVFSLQICATFFQLKVLANSLKCK